MAGQRSRLGGRPLRRALPRPGLGNQQRRRPGAAPGLPNQLPLALRQVRLRIEGAEEQTLLARPGSPTADAIHLTTTLGDFIFPLLPVITAAGAPLEPPAAPLLIGNEIVAPFVAGSAPGTNQERPAAGPAGSDLVYLTWLGGAITDYGRGIAVDDQGSAYVTGTTDSVDFPTTPGAFDTTLNDSFDAFVAKLDASGALEYATYIGGGLEDRGSRIAVDEAGNAFVTGYTYSTDFPATPGAYDTDHNGGNFDAFIAKVNADGSDLVYATYLGGAQDEYGGDIAVDAAGNAYITGYTTSINFPTTPAAYDTSFNGVIDVIAVKINPAGDDLIYATFIGADSFEFGYGIALDGQDSAYLTGHTMSMEFPVTPGAFDTIYNGGLSDAFLLKLLPDGSDLAYASFLGGANFDNGKGLAVTATGDAFVAGPTDSGNFPTTPGAYDTEYGGGRDVFALRMNASGSALWFSTFLGGSGEDEAGDLDFDSSGSAFVTGWTLSGDFPTTAGAYDPTHNGTYDAFLVMLWPAGDRLAYSTFLGQDSTNYGWGIAVDPAGGAYIAGDAGLPIDAFALKLALTPPPIHNSYLPIISAGS